MNEKEKQLAHKLLAALKEKGYTKRDHIYTLDVYGESEDDDRYGIQVSLTKNNKATLNFRSMYGNTIPLTFEVLEIIAEVFGSRDINVRSEYGGGGCDTCGHGGLYNLPIYISKMPAGL